MPDTFVASDHHAWHPPINTLCDRPFSSNEEAIEEMIRRHNKVVRPDANVFFLGDYWFGPRNDGRMAETTRRFNGRKILVVYTDGGDTRSAQTFSDVLEMLKASDVIVYGIGFLQHQPTSVRNEQKMRLQQLADVTGGQTFFPTSTKGLSQVFDQIVAQVRAQYSLGFVSTNTTHDGSWRKVEVRLNPSHLQTLRVRARRGYYAPLRDVPPTAILGGRPGAR